MTVILSIGMIVKNEADKLKKTLEALQPLRNAINAQLIIADTGSEDETLEIAQEYANEAFVIPWENDFAKARNATLQRAKGEWFFYLDADEVLEDGEELAKFLRNPKSKRFNTIKLLIRNITSNKRTGTQDFWSGRIFRIRPEEVFEGAIHEVYRTIDPTYTLQTTRLMHSGYNNDEVEVMQRKSERNRALIIHCLEREHDPYRRSKLLLEYADTAAILVGHEQEMEEYARQAIALLEEMPENDERRIYFLARAYSLCIRAYYNLKDWTGCLRIGEEYFNIQPRRCVGDTDMEFIMGDAYWQLEKAEECIAHFEKYLSLLLKDMVVVSKYMVISTVSFKDKALGLLSCAYEKLEKRDKAWQYALQIESEEYQGMNISQFQWQMAMLHDTDRRLPELWQKCDAALQEGMIKGIISSIATANEERRLDIAAGLRALPEDERVWPALAICTNDAAELIMLLMKMDNYTFTVEQGEILYQCLNLKVSMNLLLPHLNGVEQIEGYMNVCATHHSDMAQQVLHYYQHLSPQEMTLSEHHMAQYLLCHSLFCTEVSRELCNEMWPVMYHFAISYMQRVYQPEVFCGENDRVLWPLERFLLSTRESLEQREQENYSTCISLLHKGLEIYPKAKDMVEILLAEIETMIDPARAELNQLAKTVKQQIQELIAANNLTEANLLLNELVDIIPTDPEIPALLKQTQPIEMLWN